MPSLKIFVVVSQNCSWVCLCPLPKCFWQKNRWAVSLRWLLMLRTNNIHIMQPKEHAWFDSWSTLTTIAQSVTAITRVLQVLFHKPHLKTDPRAEGGKWKKGPSNQACVCLPVRRDLYPIDGCQWILLNYLRGRQQDTLLQCCPITPIMIEYVGQSFCCL